MGEGVRCAAREIRLFKQVNPCPAHLTMGQDFLATNKLIMQVGFGSGMAKLADVVPIFATPLVIFFLAKPLMHDIL